jgi:glutamate synthase (NADPH/NADH) small chain
MPIYKANDILSMQDNPRDFSKVDRKVRMRLRTRGLPVRPAAIRVRDFEEITCPLSAEWARSEAARCIHCPDPAPCYKACPAQNDISQAMWLIEQGKFLEAAQVYHQTSSMPEICGRVCPTERLCEGACVRSKKNGRTIPLGALEAFVADYERQTVGITLPVAKPIGAKVAIIGAGPAGLTCAEQLARRGHWVTIFDARPAPGGLLTYGIPSFKLSKSVVLTKWGDLRRAGVSFVGNTYIGKARTINDLLAEGYEAVFIGVGVGSDITMNAPGEDLPGVYKATEFLVRANVDTALLPPEMRKRPEVGERVVVIGAGDTAMDCLRTALRIGAREVTCLYRRNRKAMPSRGRDLKLALEEGAKFQFYTQPIRFIAGEDGRLAQIECLRTRLDGRDASGRRRPIPVAGTNFIVEADTVVLALGYRPDPTISATTPGLKARNWGLIIADPETGATTRFGLFVGGDIVTGPNLVVTAMVAGRRAAATIDAYLS